MGLHQGDRVGLIGYHSEMVRCGKASCSRCREGRAHGPYWYADWRDDQGRRWKRYCGKTPPSTYWKEWGEADVCLSDALQPLRIRMLGGFEVERGGLVLEGCNWPRSGARELLALLLLNPRGLGREEAGEALRPEGHPAKTQVALRTDLSALRRVLEPPEDQPTGTRQRSRRLPLGEDRLRLRLTPWDWVDMQEFQRTDCSAGLDLASLRQLVDLYRGELLPEFRYADWAAGARESLRARWHRLSVLLAEDLLAADEPREAIGRLQVLLSDDPTQEEAAQSLMVALTEQGWRGEALRVYRHLEYALVTDLGLEPSDVSRELAEGLGGATWDHHAHHSRRP